MDRASVVVGGATQVIQIHQHDLAPSRGYVAVRRESADAVMNWRGADRVVNINELIRAEVWIERDTEQPAFARRRHRERHKWRGQERPIFYHAELSVLLADEQPPVRRK